MKAKELTKAGTPRVRAPGGGRKAKAPGTKLLSKQIRVHLHTFDKLTTLAQRTGRPITEIVGDAVAAMPLPAAVPPGDYAPGYEQ